MNWREYSAAEFQEISDSVGDRHGWDFSHMSTEREPVPWDFHEIAKRYLRPTDLVLDIGTGGGERLLELAEHYRSAIGVDPDPEMIQAANQNAANVPRVSFQNMSAERLLLNNETVDAVLTRHAPTFVPELHRVMRPGGRFICQGIGARNMENIRRAFGTGEETLYEDEYQQLILDLKARGWSILVTGMYDVDYWVKDPASLLF